MESELEKELDNLGNHGSKDSDIKSRFREETLKGKQQDRLLRRKFGDKIFDLVCWYMSAVFFLLLLCGMPNSFHLSDTVLVTILGTTTANIIGILVIVATYYFHKK